MASTLHELELEALPELEGEGEFETLHEVSHEGEYELEGEGEFEFENEQFLGGLLGMAGKALGGLLGEGELEGEFEFEGEGEFELEGESEGEGEFELNPIRRVYPDALMEHLVHEAMSAQNEQEVEQFLPALIPLAMKAAPMLMRAAPRIMRSARPLMRTLNGIGRRLYRRRRTRPLMRTLPQIARNTVRRLSQPGPNGQPRQVTPQVASRVMRQEAARILGNRNNLVRVYRRSRALDRRFHRPLVVVNVQG